MEMEDTGVELEDGTAQRRDVRMSTPERQPPVKRRTDEDDMPVDDESLKARSLIEDSDMGVSSTQKDEAVSGEDRKIITGMRLGVGITEVYSLSRG